MKRIIESGEKLSQDITDLEKTLESNQVAFGKLFKRLGLIGLAMAGVWSAIWPQIEKLPDRVNDGQIQKIEDTPGERVFKVRGGQHPED